MKIEAGKKYRVKGSPEHIFEDGEFVFTERRDAYGTWVCRNEKGIMQYVKELNLSDISSDNQQKEEA